MVTMGKIQDYFIISSEKLNSRLNIYHITVDNSTHYIFFITQKTIVVNRYNVKRNISNNLVIYTVL